MKRTAGTFRFVILDPLDRLDGVRRWVRREFPKAARATQRHLKATHTGRAFVVVQDNPHQCVPGGTCGGWCEWEMRSIWVVLDGAAYQRSPQRVLEELRATFVHEYVHAVTESVWGIYWGSPQFTLLHSLWSEMLTTHAEQKIAEAPRPHYTIAKNFREIELLARSMRRDLNQPAYKVDKKWRFPPEASRRWALYKVAWALGELYFQDHSFAQALKATPSEMRSIYERLANKRKEGKNAAHNAKG